jgi:hypothetical protein
MYRTIFLPVIKYWYHMVSQFEGRTEIGSIWKQHAQESIKP